MSILICGSIAYDHIMVFPDQFKNHILPEKVHILNVSFLVPEMRREYGGCAGNIVYNLNLLEPSLGKPMATVGKDFGTYTLWMEKRGIEQTHIKIIEDAYTGQAFITTDLDDNQITAFHPGAMNESHQNHVGDAEGIELGIISPDGRAGMVQHAKEFVDAGIPFIFDPGQGMPMFDGDDLKQFINQATWVTVNDYEWQLMHDRTGLSPEEVAQKVEALIITRGGEGSNIYTNGVMITVPVVQAKQIADPTGCGDAYRAGLLYGLHHKFDWQVTGQIASLMGSIKIETAGTQNHRFTLDEFKARYEKEFGSSF